MEELLNAVFYKRLIVRRLSKIAENRVFATESEMVSKNSVDFNVVC